MKKKILYIQLGDGVEGVWKALAEFDGANTTSVGDLSANFKERDFDVLIVEIGPFKPGNINAREQYVSNISHMHGPKASVIAIRTDDTQLTVFGAFVTLTATQAKKDIKVWVEKIFELS